MSARLITLIVIIASCFTQAVAFAPAAPTAEGTTDIYPDDNKPEPKDSVEHPGFLARIIRYFSESNKPKENKAFDFSIIGGPHFSSDTKLGLGLVAAGQYRTNRTDSVTALSNVSLYGDISTVGFYLIGIRGNHFTPGNRFRLDYNMHFYSFPRKFWGIGYHAGNDYKHSSKFDEFSLRAYAQIMAHLGNGFYVGPGLTFSHDRARHAERPDMWEGQRMKIVSFGPSLTAMYDTRDNVTNPHKGVFASVKQRFYPRFLGNKYAFSSTTVDFNAYFSVWKGAVVAGNVHAAFSYGNVPWSLMPTFGGSNTMRGYYEGRFRDKCEADFTIELRQHVWRRNGIVVWGGAGSVFPRLNEFKARHILPNGGIGYRWEFKKNTNVRLDFGIGRGETAFIFNINESF